MKINGKAEWKYKAIITAHGDTQMYTFPSKDAMDTGIELYISIFPFIKVQIVSEEESNAIPIELLVINKFQLN